MAAGAAGSPKTESSSAKPLMPKKKAISRLTHIAFARRPPTRSPLLARASFVSARLQNRDAADIRGGYLCTILRLRVVSRLVKLAICPRLERCAVSRWAIASPLESISTSRRRDEGPPMRLSMRRVSRGTSVPEGGGPGVSFGGAAGSGILGAGAAATSGGAPGASNTWLRCDEQHPRLAVDSARIDDFDGQNLAAGWSCQPRGGRVQPGQGGAACRPLRPWSRGPRSRRRPGRWGDLRPHAEPKFDARARPHRWLRWHFIGYDATDFGELPAGSGGSSGAVVPAPARAAQSGEPAPGAVSPRTRRVTLPASGTKVVAIA